MYCFEGILMWEIFTGGEMPYGRAKNAEVVEDVCHKQARLPRPTKCPEIVYDIMHSCWAAVSNTYIMDLDRFYTQ